MKTKSEHLLGVCQPKSGWAFLDPRHFSAQAHRGDDDFRHGERGNVLIYVLIAIALFAALSFTLMKQSDDSEAGHLSEEKAELYATQIISYAAQAKSAIDQMMFTGATNIDELDFTLPSEAGFNTGTLIHKVYHPQGGGLTPAKLDDAWVKSGPGSPAGIHFVKKNVEWTKTTGTDVIMSFYRLSTPVCKKIADKIDGSLPSYSAYTMKNVFVNQSSTDTLNSTFCGGCVDKFSAVINLSSSGLCTFYVVIADR